MSFTKFNKYSSKHYEFFFVAGSTAEKDIVIIASIQENSFHFDTNYIISKEEYEYNV